MADMILTEKNLVFRHSMLELAEHWLIAISGLILFLTGMFELPMANRYYISSVQGLAWSADFITSLYIHYYAAIIFTAVGLFHLVYHGIRGENGMIPQKGDMAASVTIIKSLFGFGEEPPMHKYLPEQRLAYVGMTFIMAMLIISGMIKTYKNIYAPDMSLTIVLWATWIHNIFFILFFLAFLGHMAAIALRPNWPMVRGIFTGSVRLGYARHRHSLWIADIEKVDAVPVAVAPEIALTAIESEPLLETETPPQEELMPVTEGEPAKIDDETTKQKISKD